MNFIKLEVLSYSEMESITGGSTIWGWIGELFGGSGYFQGIGDAVENGYGGKL